MKTSSRNRQGAVAAFLLLFSGTALFAQSRPLNPTVKVLPRATASVPAECDDGAAAVPMPPRVQIEEIPRPPDVRADMQVPPSRDLRDTLRATQAAAEANDRERFRSTLTEARALVATYPPGGEKTIASDVLSVLADVERLWDYQFSSPTGAFFDAGAENGALITMLRRYPGYEDFVRRQMIVDSNGNRFYPARESRDFLLRESAQRLSRLGVRTGTTPTARVTTPAPSTPSTTTTTPSTRSTTTTPSTRSTTTTPSTGGLKPAPTSTAAPRVTERRRTSTSSTARKKPAATKRAAAPVEESEPATTPTDDIPIPPPVVAAPADQVPVTTTETAPSDTTTTTTTMSAQTDTTTTVTPVQKPAPRSRNIVMPLVLILIGVGVLVVLFRASS